MKRLQATDPLVMEIWRAFYPKGTHNRQTPEAVDKCLALAERLYGLGYELKALRNKVKCKCDFEGDGILICPACGLDNVSGQYLVGK